MTRLSSNVNLEQRHTKLVLASASPRRLELLQQLGYQPSTLPVDIDETPVVNEDPLPYVERMAREKLEKALSLLASRADKSTRRVIALAGDTVCIQGQDILVKPEGYEDFKRMMASMSGAKQTVASSFALGELVEGERAVLHLEIVQTDVYFKRLDASEVLAYWETGEPADKAGGYGIQGLGAVFVERIEGSYSNVVGLPLMEVHRELKSLGVPSKM